MLQSLQLPFALLPVLIFSRFAYTLSLLHHHNLHFEAIYSLLYHYHFIYFSFLSSDARWMGVFKTGPILRAICWVFAGLVLVINVYLVFVPGSGITSYSCQSLSHSLSDSLVLVHQLTGSSIFDLLPHEWWVWLLCGIVGLLYFVFIFWVMLAPRYMRDRLPLRLQRLLRSRKEPDHVQLLSDDEDGDDDDDDDDPNNNDGVQLSCAAHASTSTAYQTVAINDSVRPPSRPGSTVSFDRRVLVVDSPMDYQI